MSNCYKGWPEEYGGHGDCCCNCKYFLQVTCHPWNKEPFKGKITSPIVVGEDAPLNVCTVWGREDGGWVAIAMTKGHGMCEMHTRRNNV